MRKRRFNRVGVHPRLNPVLHYSDEILKYRFEIQKIPKYFYNPKHDPHKILPRPAAIALFTLGEWLAIFTQIQLNPFAKSHYMVFPHGKYIIRLFRDDDKDLRKKKNIHTLPSR